MSKRNETVNRIYQRAANQLDLAGLNAYERRNLRAALNDAYDAGKAHGIDGETIADLDGTDDAAGWLTPGHVLDADEVAMLRGLRVAA